MLLLALSCLSRAAEASSNEECNNLQLLEQLRTSLLQKLSLLHKLTDNFALLDMLNAFATTIQASGGSFVRPSFTKSGPVAIQQVCSQVQR